MTQQQLQDLITNTLGPIVDAACRITDGMPRLIDEYLHIRDQHAKGAMTQEEFDRYNNRIWARLYVVDRLAFLIQLAREDGKLALAPAHDPNAGLHHHEQLATRADQNWAAIVAEKSEYSGR
jgi:hypothetical protein